MKIKKIFPLVIVVLLLSACGILPSGQPAQTLIPSITIQESQAIASATPVMADLLPETATSTQESPTQTKSPPPPETPVPEKSEGAVSDPEKYIYSVQMGSPAIMTNWGHPEVACDWLGIAGLVFDKDSKPVINIVVEAGGILGNNPVFGLSITGLADIYGVGGYEIVLADHPIASAGTVWVQLYGLDGRPLSEKIFINTSDKCAENLVNLNFVEGVAIGEFIDVYLPWLSMDFLVP